MAATHRTGGSLASPIDTYSIPNEAAKLLQTGLLHNPLVFRNLPPEAQVLSEKISFSGSPLPALAINWRFAESIAALKALEGIFINTLLIRKYEAEPQEIKINTDHAQLFIVSPGLYTIDPDGDAITTSAARHNPALAKIAEQYFPIKKWGDCEQHHGELYAQNATNIYRCKDGRFFHVHGDLNPGTLLASLGLPRYRPDITTSEDARAPFIEKLAHIDSEEMETLMNDVLKISGSRCWSTNEYQNTEHAAAQRDVGLWEVLPINIGAHQGPCWWPESPQTSVQRPLAGLRVVDLTRIIAAPAITRGLAELGASVMRITGEHIPDNPHLHCDLNWGKWNGHLDFRLEVDRERMRELVREADVVVLGYRPAVFDKYGFSAEDLIDLCKDRNRGLIVVKENCYGWKGLWSQRSGWQQISDANCGVSLAFGQAMGVDEPVTPVFPNSDFCTGMAGIVGTLDAILRRGKNGGSFIVEVALNYYSQWLVNSVGTYPANVWDDVWTRNGRQVFRHYDTMPFTIPRYMAMLHKHSPHIIQNPAYFENRENRTIGKKIRTVKPVLRFPEGGVKLGFNVGTRTNGVDQPRWPIDLMTEIVV